MQWFDHLRLTETVYCLRLYNNHEIPLKTSLKLIHLEYRRFFKIEVTLMYSVWYSCTWFLKSDNSIRQSYCRRRAINFLQSRPYISSPQLRARANHTGHTALEVNRNFHFRISLHRKFSPPRVLYRSPRLYMLYHCGLKFFLKKHCFFFKWWVFYLSKKLSRPKMRIIV